MPHYYEILEIRREANRVEIKAAFRIQAKKCHPDLHPAKAGWAHGRMREILRAYEVLIDDEKRAIYDRTIAHLDRMKAPSLRDRLKKRKGDPKAACRLLFLDLLEGRGREGLALYKELTARDTGFSLKTHMRLSDYMDCSFLLAEEYERQDSPETAFELYRHLYGEDRKYDYFKHFREEILFRMRNLLVGFLREEGRLTMALRGISEIVGSGFPRKERAFLYKKAAESLCRDGQRRLARLSFFSALLLDPKMGGTKKIRKRLGLDREAIA